MCVNKNQQVYTGVLTEVATARASWSDRASYAKALMAANGMNPKAAAKPKAAPKADK